MKTIITFIGQTTALFLTRLRASRHRVVFGLLLLTQLVSACGKPVDVIDSATQSPPPAGVGGKWLYGTFSLGSFWGTNGSYQGAGYEQSKAIEFGANGTYDMYVVNVTTYYSCRTGAYTHVKGKAKFNEADRSVTFTPTEATYRGEYSCYPGKNFQRPATSTELTQFQQTYYYQPETDTKGGQALRIYFGSTDNQGTQFERGNW
ncbi:hypothetical protein [Spirosoma harenae]